jgi:hypothetical protein
MGERYKLCRECGSEFVAAVETCIDCGGPLEEAVLGAEEAMTAPPAGSLAAEEPMAPLREGEPGFLRDLAERLAIAGVPHRLAVHGDCTTGCRTRYAVYVRPADWAAAMAVDRAFYAAAVPGGDGAVELDGDGCPACGTSLAPGAVECPECGLMVGGPGEADEVAG